MDQLHCSLLQRSPATVELVHHSGWKGPRIKVLESVAWCEQSSYPAPGERRPIPGRCHKTSLSNPKLAGSVSSYWVAELQPLAAVLELASTLRVLVILWSYLGS